MPLPIPGVISLMLSFALRHNLQQKLYTNSFKEQSFEKSNLLINPPTRLITYLPLMPFPQGPGDRNLIWQINSFLFTFLGISASKGIKEPAGSSAEYYQILYFFMPSWFRFSERFKVDITGKIHTSAHLAARISSLQPPSVTNGRNTAALLTIGTFANAGNTHHLTH